MKFCSLLLICVLCICGCCENKDTVKQKNLSERLTTIAECEQNIKEYSENSASFTPEQIFSIIEKLAVLLKDKPALLFRYYTFSMNDITRKIICENTFKIIKDSKDTAVIVAGCKVLSRAIAHYPQYKPEILSLIKKIDFKSADPDTQKSIMNIASALIVNEPPDSDYVMFHSSITDASNDSTMMIEQAILNESTGAEFARKVYLQIIKGNFTDEEKSLASFNLAQTYWDDTSENPLSKEHAKEYFKMTLNFDPEFILKDEVVEKLQALGFSKPAQMVIYDENGNIITDIEGGLPPEDTWEVMIEDFPESTTDDFFSVPEYGEDDEIIEDFDIAEPEDEIIEE